jgi:serine/threonine-protein kinase
MADLPAADDPDFGLLQAYVDQLHRGGTPDRDALLARRPDLARMLECLDGLNKLALPPDGEPATVSPTAMIESSSANHEPSVPRVHSTFGKYFLEAELGRGGMGVVFKARQTDLGRQVALKMVLSTHLASPEALARFQEEARAAAGLTHPHIVTVYEAGQIEGQPYFAMQYVAGSSLSQRLRSGPLEPDEAARIVLAIAGAVQHLHSHGILHRDLKPSNILLDEAGQPYVTDFGLVKTLTGDQQRTVSGAIVGTPSYMSPEQAASRRDLGPASDVYGLGAILYELLTGQPPFREESPLDTLVQVMESEPAAPRRLRPHIPAELELICLRCLEKNPAERFPSAGALADALAAFLKGEETGLSLPGMRYRVRHWSRREPALVSRLIMLPVCLVLAQLGYTLAGDATLAVHLTVLALLAGWAAASFACQWLMNHRPWADGARFLWSAVDVLFFSSIVLIAEEINTPIVVGYPLLIAASGLWFRERLVWFTAAVCAVSYAALCVAHAVRTGQLTGPHHHVIFLVGLIILAFVISYKVRRVRALSQFYEHRRLP